MKYRKKPVVIEAVQYVGGNYKEIKEFCPNVLTNTCYSYLTIPTLEGHMKADVGDWIIRGIKGEFYPCKPDIFEKTYEKVIPNEEAIITKEDMEHYTNDIGI